MTTTTDAREATEPAGAPVGARYDHVVVPLDGSRRSAEATRAGTTLARAFGARTSYLTVVPRPEDLDGAADDGVRWVPRDQLKVHLTSDAPGTILAEHAGDGTALRCLASRGRGRVGGAVLGSVAEAVVRRSDGPVVVVGPRFDPTRFRTVERIVACVDGSDASERVLPTVVAWARTLGVDVEIVTVLGPRSAVPPAARADTVETAGVEALARRLTDGDVRPGWEVLHDDDPAAAIVRHAADVPGTVVAMHTHGRRGADRLRFGSVAMRVVHDSPAPVLLTGPALDDRS